MSQLLSGEKNAPLLKILSDVPASTCLDTSTGVAQVGVKELSDTYFHNPVVPSIFQPLKEFDKSICIRRYILSFHCYSETERQGAAIECPWIIRSISGSHSLPRLPRGQGSTGTRITHERVGYLEMIHAVEKPNLYRRWQNSRGR